MIIKSLGRKARTQAYGRRGQRAVNAFRALAAYMNRGIHEEEGRAILWHNFPGGEEMDEDALVAEFEANARRLRERKNGNVLYHEILSFSTGHELDADRLARHIADVGQEYLRRRAPEQLAYGVIHLDTDHIHLHLMVSANRVRSADRVRLSKADFADIQRETERYLLAKYPELAQTRIYDRDAAERAQARAEKVKGQVHEQAMKIRTGAASHKDALKMRLHHLFERAGSVAELHRLAEKEGLSFYQRGKSVGVIERDPSGNPKKHRLATLGVDLHYARTLERFTRHHDAKSGQSRTSRTTSTPTHDADPMKPAATPSKIIESVGETAKDIGSSRQPPETSRAKEILDEELRFGKEVAKDFIFGPDRSDRRPNHEKPPETKEERRLRLLREAKERRQARDQGKDRGDDHER